MSRISFWRHLSLAIVCTFLMMLSQALVIPSYPVFAQSSSVTINPTQGSPNTNVTGTGSNWAAGDQMQVSWADTGAVLANTTVQSNGTFTVSFKIPSNAGQGGHNIYFTALNSHYFLPAVFTVTANPSSAPAPSKPTSPTIIVQNVFTADSNNNPLSTFVPGDPIHYRVDVLNTSSASVPATVTYQVTGPQPIYTQSVSTSFPSGLSRFYSAPSIPTTAPAGTYTITVTVTSNGMSSQKQSQFTIKRPSNLSITQTSFQNSVWAGGAMTYTITVNNKGTSTATNVTMIDHLPSDVFAIIGTPLLSQGSCTWSNWPITVTCTLGNLSPGMGATVSLYASILGTAQPGVMTATATVQSAQSSNGANPTARLSTTISPPTPLSASDLNESLNLAVSCGSGLPGVPPFLPEVQQISQDLQHGKITQLQAFDLLKSTTIDLILKKLPALDKFMTAVSCVNYGREIFSIGP